MEPSKILQPAIVCVSEEDENRTVQLRHVTPLKVCWPLLCENHTLICIHISCNTNRIKKKIILWKQVSHWFMTQWMFNRMSVWVCSMNVTVWEKWPTSYLRTVYFPSLVFLMHANKNYACVSAVNNLYPPYLIPQKGLHHWTFPASAIRGVR